MGDGIKLDVRPPEASGDETLVSAIIPLSIREAEPGALLATLPRTFEIILARGGTRASSMNAAALAARGRHLWFVHADTAVTPDAVEALLAQLNRESDALRYFDLRFDGGALMRLTELGVWFRSRALGIPFGDQALCLPAHWFKALGGYAEAAAHGEDHLLVRQARRAGLPVHPVGKTVLTSARKYRSNGWFRTTLTHWRLTLQQALRGSRGGPDRRALQLRREEDKA